MTLRADAVFNAADKAQQAVEDGERVRRAAGASKTGLRVERAKAENGKASLFKTGLKSPSGMTCVAP